MTLDWLSLPDRPALIAAPRQVMGWRFLGGVDDGYGAVELVFEDGGAGTGNLVTIFVSGHWAGRVGAVAGPARYVAACEEYRRELEAS